MSDFQAFIVSFCGVCAVIGGIYILCPKGNISKTVKYVINLTVICAFVGLLSVAFKFDYSFDKYEGYTKTSEMSAQVVKMIFETALKNSNVSFKKIEIITDKTADNSISINKVFVYSEESPEKIKEILNKESSFSIEVINE